MDSKKTIQMNLFTKQNRIRLTDIRNKLIVTKGKSGGGINQEFRINRYKLLYKKGLSDGSDGKESACNMGDLV